MSVTFVKNDLDDFDCTLPHYPISWKASIIGYYREGVIEKIINKIVDVIPNSYVDRYNGQAITILVVYLKDNYDDILFMLYASIGTFDER